MKIKLIVLSAVLSFSACNKKEEPPAALAETASAAALQPAPPPIAAAAPEATPVDVDTLPVEEQFEGDAEVALTSANLNAKLDELEKEISAP